MKKLLAIVMCVVLCGLSGCGGENNASVSSDYDWLPSVKNKDEIVLYDKYDQRIVSYNTKNFTVDEKNDTQNYMQFEFNDLRSNVYTTGHSIENKYKIVEDKNNKIATLYRMKGNEAVFPLAYRDDATMFFLKTSYDSQGGEIYNDRVICKFDVQSGQLKEVPSTKGYLVSYAVVIGNLLYFTVYHDDNKNYDLYSLNLDKEDKLNLVATGLIAEEVYNNNGRLFVSDKNVICDYENREVQFSKKPLNYFYHNYLLQIHASDEGDAQLLVTDMKAKKVVRSVNNIIDVRVKNNTVYAYALGAIIVI